MKTLILAFLCLCIAVELWLTRQHGEPVVQCFTSRGINK